MNVDNQDTIRLLRSSLNGQEPPTSIVADIGGWDALAEAVDTLVDDPLLHVVTSIVCRDLDPDDPACIATSHTLVDVVAKTGDPTTFASVVDTMCGSPRFLGVAGSRLADACLSLACPPDSHDLRDTSAGVIRAGEALEVLTRLALDEHGSRFKVLALLSDIKGAQPPRYARAVLRSITAAYDHWDGVDDIVAVVEVVAEDGGVVAEDVEWTAANIEVLRALRSSTATAALEHFSAARARLAEVEDYREDAAILNRVLGHLEQLMAVAAAGDPVPVQALMFDTGALTALQRDAEQYAVTSSGLDHWAGNRKRVVVASWVHLAEDLTWLGDQMDRDVFYEVATVVDRIAAIYDASHSYDFTAHRAGAGLVHKVLRPAIEGGFVQRATLMRHLSDHAEALQQQACAAPNDAALGRRLEGVRVLLESARERLLASEPPGKGDEQAAVPALLADLLEGSPELAKKIAHTLTAEDLATVATAVATYHHISRTEPDLTVDAIITDIVTKLHKSDDFTGAVADAVTRVVRALTLYVASMTNVQKSDEQWLFQASVPESKLHNHLLTWLWSNHFRQRAKSEVQSVAGGRTDIQFAFEGFTLVAELKVDTTHVALEDKPKYIRQTAAYGNTDIKIGFLVVLRTPASGATNLDDLASNVIHATIDGNGGAGDRHVVMFDIPGNRTPPSSG
ncbi:hypothetical protein [Micrococcus sp. IITD107]|uniref:hypothetical protein n=1 Tax=Micrococcus sp. IITD107 TaxID=3342790 RepID=UPI0035B6DB4D